jgi:hypothetical protein
MHENNVKHILTFKDKLKPCMQQKTKGQEDFSYKFRESKREKKIETENLGDGFRMSY